jgi:hypothetical protein
MSNDLKLKYLCYDNFEIKLESRIPYGPFSAFFQV